MENAESERIERIVSQYASKIKDSRIFFTPNIPNNILKQILRSDTIIKENETPLVLVDNHDKEGLVLTNQRLYIHEMRGTIQSFSFKEIQSITIEKKWYANNFYMNGQMYFASIITTEAMEQLCHMISDIIAVVIPSNASNISVGMPLPEDNKISNTYVKMDTQAIKLYMKKGMYAEALEALDEALELMKNNRWLLENKGDILKRLGRFKEALEYYNLIEMRIFIFGFFFCFIGSPILWVVGTLISKWADAYKNSPGNPIVSLFFAFIYLVSLIFLLGAITCLGFSIYSLFRWSRLYFKKQNLKSLLDSLNKQSN